MSLKNKVNLSAMLETQILLIFDGHGGRVSKCRTLGLRMDSSIYTIWQQRVTGLHIHYVIIHAYLFRHIHYIIIHIYLVRHIHYIIILACQLFKERMLCWRFQYISPIFQNDKFSLCVLKTFFSYEVFEKAWMIHVKIASSGQPTKACWPPTSQIGVVLRKIPRMRECNEWLSQFQIF